jgi:hypothetical protein
MGEYSDEFYSNIPVWKDNGERNYINYNESTNLIIEEVKNKTEETEGKSEKSEDKTEEAKDIPKAQNQNIKGVIKLAAKQDSN